MSSGLIICKLQGIIKLLLNKILLNQMISITGQSVEKSIISVSMHYFFQRDIYERKLTLEEADNEQS